jgi:hypothetical protein
MRFEIEQRFSADADAVAAAYADPALYAALDGLAKLTQPEVVHHEQQGSVVVLDVRYHFGGDLSAAARAVLDPSRLTWIEHTVHRLDARTATFELRPDHHRDRFRCSGSYRFEPAGSACRRVGTGDLRVKALLVAGAVEGAIVSGLREHLADEVPVVEAFVAGRQR